MSIAELHNKHDYTPYSLLFEPFIEGRQDLRLARIGKIVKYHELYPASFEVCSLSFWERTFYLIKGIIYCIPIINTIVSLARKILKSPASITADQNMMYLKKILPKIIQQNGRVYRHYNVALPEEYAFSILLLDQLGNLLGVEYGERLERCYRRPFPRHPGTKQMFYTILSIRMTNDRHNNHCPFFLSPEEKARDDGLGGPINWASTKAQAVISKMIDKLNEKHSEIAVVQR